MDRIVLSLLHDDVSQGVSKSVIFFGEFERSGSIGRPGQLFFIRFALVHLFAIRRSNTSPSAKRKNFCAEK
jgi:hypothetical protein